MPLQGQGRHGTAQRAPLPQQCERRRYASRPEAASHRLDSCVRPTPMTLVEKLPNANTPFNDSNKQHISPSDAWVLRLFSQFLFSLCSWGQWSDLPSDQPARFRRLSFVRMQHGSWTTVIGHYSPSNITLESDLLASL